MLKSIVNGAEHDIVRIPMRSKQLWNEVVSLIDTNLGKRYGFIIDVPGTYTVKVYGDILSTDFVYGNVYSNGTYSSNYYLVVNGRISAYTFTIADGEHATIYDANADSESTALGKFARWDIMANEGSTALPYVPYGMVEGWEVRDNQNRLIWGREDELQTTTGNLLFKGYDLPVKVNSLLGSAAQNGTPSPDNVVIPEFCGVRTENLINVYANNTSNGYIDNAMIRKGGDIYEPSSSFVSEYQPINEGVTYTLNTGGRTGDAQSICFYTSDKQFISGISYESKTIITFTTPQGAKYFRCTVMRTQNDTESYKHTMLNVGTESIQYEPYGWKIPIENHGENLCSISTWTNSQSTDTRSHFQIRVLAYMGNTIVSASPYVNTSNPGVYTTSITLSGTADKLVIKHNGSSRDLIVANVMINGTVGESYTVSMYVETNDPTTMDGIKVRDIMLNSGSTPLPYSPYLNKTTPIYLGEVPTIRRIKKLVLTGEELLYKYTYQETNGCYGTLLDQTYYSDQGMCSHYPVGNVGVENTLWIGANNASIYFVGILDALSMSTVEDFKAYLAAQYANGTPVTIWYALANPETGIVNEPLAKIGDHADELTEISVHNLSAPLYGIGDYKDILNLSTGVLTRKIKKYEFTGQENISQGSENFYTSLPTPGMPYSNMYCTHNVDGACMVNNNGGYIWLKISSWSDYATAGELKAFFQQEYAAGTPVTIWYVLATPETETITVPTGMTGEIEGYLTQISTPTPEHPSIPKWNGKEETGGTYAVTVYDLPEIPTTTGKNTLTVETEKIHGLTNPLCGIGDYKDVLNLSTGIITRKIKKFVLTGEEGWSIYQNTYYYTKASNYYRMYDVGRNLSVCSHYPNSQTSEPQEMHYTLGGLVDGSTNTVWNGNIVFAPSPMISSLTDWKSYLADQYANGTPVTIWYVLETPETETITVPYGLECSVEGYLTQSGIPTPSNPITPESNGILESGGTYAVEVSLVPSNLTVKGHIKAIQ